jgi:hypothetical protein
MSPLPDSVFEPEPPGQPPPEGVQRDRSLRPRSAWAGWTTASWALYVLAALVLAGVVLRVVASVAAWPTLPTLGDSWPYAYYAGADVFGNPQHPAGYSIFLGLIGFVTHTVGAFVVLQHLMGIVSALILFAAVRRLCGSPWPGVVGAAVILLGADQLYLEDLIMSETLFTLLLVSGVYAMARALEQPRRGWPWPAIAATLIVLAGITRTAGLFLLPLAFLTLLLVEPRPWRPRWPSLAVFTGVACALLFAYATANSMSRDTFSISPSSGWRLYVRVAPFADCNKFTPPKGTAGLCERKPPGDRYGSSWYLYDPQSPAVKMFGHFGNGDSQLAAFARQVVLHQPGEYLDAVFSDIEAYFFPSTYGPWEEGKGTDIDGQLSWMWVSEPPEKVQAETKHGMETFFSPFVVRRNQGAIDFLYDYQRKFRFGATMLVVATLLLLMGLCIGSRRNRIGVLLLGIGGLATIVPPVFASEYIGRYIVPPAGMIAAGATIALLALTGRSSPIRSRIERLFAGRSPSPSA